MMYLLGIFLYIMYFFILSTNFNITLTLYGHKTLDLCHSPSSKRSSSKGTSCSYIGWISLAIYHTRWWLELIILYWILEISKRVDFRCLHYILDKWIYQEVDMLIGLTVVIISLYKCILIRYNLNTYNFYLKIKTNRYPPSQKEHFFSAFWGSDLEWRGVLWALLEHWSSYSPCKLQQNVWL